jgi:hypothetical protein
MEILNESTILTDKYPRVIKRRVYYYRHFIKRHILKPNERIDAITLIQLLNDYFPGLRFFDIEKKTDKKWDIEKYFYKEQGKWILDITAMSKNENYARLFPKDISHWDEVLSRSKYGSADVIRFFIYEQNETFLDKISCLNRTIRFDKNAVPEKFLKEIKYYEGTDVWDIWNFSKIVELKPSSIYEAFAYYARSQYNLLAFTLNDASYNDNDPLNNDADYLINRGEKIIDNAVEEHYPEMKKLRIELEKMIENSGAKQEQKTQKQEIQDQKIIEKYYRFLKLEREILQSAPKKGTDVPRGLEKFIELLRNGIYEIKKKKYDDSDLPYTKSDLRTINNLLAKIIPYLNEDEKGKMKWGTLDKMDLLHSYIERFSQREQTSVKVLFLKKNTLSLDNNEDEDEKPRNRYNATPDEQYLYPEDRFIRLNRQQLPFIEFKKEFKKEFEKEFEKKFKDELREKLKLFKEKLLDKLWEILQEYFEKYPLPLYYDSDEFFKKNNNSIEKLSEIFCSYADIPESEGIKKQFEVMFRRAFKNAIDNIKRNLNDIEGANYG